MKVISTNATGLRTQARDVVEQVHWNNARCLVYRYRSPVAVMLSAEEYERLTGQTVAQLEQRTERSFGKKPISRSYPRRLS